MFSATNGRSHCFGSLLFNPYNLNVETDILTEKDVEDIHYQLIKSQAIDINLESNEIAISFRKHLYDGLEFALKEDRLREADLKTTQIMLYIAGKYEDKFFTVQSLQNFSCDALREIDKRWYNYPKRKGHFGFRVQKEIWESTEIGSPTINSPYTDWIKFYIEVGWWEESGIRIVDGNFVSYSNLGAFKDINLSRRGNLPTFLWGGVFFHLRWFVWLVTRVFGNFRHYPVMKYLLEWQITDLGYIVNIPTSQ